MSVEFRSVTGGVAITTLLVLGFPVQPGAGVASAGEPGLPWKSLVFEGQRHFIKTRIDASLQRLPSDEVLPTLVRSPQGKDLRPSERDVMVMRTKSSAEGPFVGGERRDMTVWFDPSSGAALQRDRLRRGKKPDNKLYRYTHKGVYRLRRKPREGTEMALSPEGWTLVKQSFYPFPPALKDCQAVTEPSVLLYTLSVTPLPEMNAGRGMCVFHQQHVHWVSLQPLGEEQVVADFGQGPQNITAVKVALRARPLDGNQGDEDFAFLGLEGDIEIAFDKASRIPVRVSGTLPRIGPVSFHLREALAD